MATTSHFFLNEAQSELRAVGRSLAKPVELKLEAEPSGILLVTLAQPQEVQLFIQALKERRLVFVRHIHAIDEVIDVGLKNEASLREQLVLGVHRLILAWKQKPLVSSHMDTLGLTLQVRKVDSSIPVSGGEVAAWLRQDLSDFWSLNGSTGPILSCSILGERIFLGIGDASSNLSPRIGGAWHFDMRRFPVSRAGSKLKEALEVFDISPSPVETSCQTRRRAVDLGAAPGGWTAVLVDHGYWVDAVDPGELHASLLAHPMVHAQRMKSQDFKPGPASYDLITCDVNWDPFETARAVRALAYSLKSDGFAIVTVKMTNGSAPELIKSVCRILSDVYVIRDIKLLFHNRREVTLLLGKPNSK
jgi:23S rRNA (cytidine2498-2'-O)-methyltransferase